MADVAQPNLAARTHTTPSRAAERMRRSRDRRSKGLRCCVLELRDTEIDALVRRGFLAEGEKDDKSAVGQAMRAFLDSRPTLHA